jgi:hypothetical protein
LEALAVFHSTPHSLIRLCSASRPLDVKGRAAAVVVVAAGTSAFFRTEFIVVGAVVAGAIGAAATSLALLTAGTTGAAVATGADAVQVLESQTIFGQQEQCQQSSSLSTACCSLA